MKKIKPILISAVSIVVGAILGSLVQPLNRGWTGHSTSFQTAVDNPEFVDECCSIEDIALVEEKIREHNLEWTHIDYKGGDHIGIITYDFRPWGKKRVQEKLEIAKQILRECREKK
ncbi:hypothetical protein P4E94_19720 [Pontiellaceae bacterium B12219]|nr:hypothetical protein [Pontiellaceae bacterium B12219]